MPAWVEAVGGGRGTPRRTGSAQGRCAGAGAHPATARVSTRTPFLRVPSHRHRRKPPASRQAFWFVRSRHTGRLRCGLRRTDRARGRRPLRRRRRGPMPDAAPLPPSASSTIHRSIQCPPAAGACRAGPWQAPIAQRMDRHHLLCTGPHRHASARFGTASPPCVPPLVLLVNSAAVAAATEAPRRQRKAPNGPLTSHYAPSLNEPARHRPVPPSSTPKQTGPVSATMHCEASRGQSKRAKFSRAFSRSNRKSVGRARLQPPTKVKACARGGRVRPPASGATVHSVPPLLTAHMCPPQMATASDRVVCGAPASCAFEHWPADPQPFSGPPSHPSSGGPLAVSVYPQVAPS